MNIVSDLVQVAVPGVERPMAALLVRQGDGRSGPAVLLLSDVAGVNQHMRELAARLAELGYIVIVPNLWHRSRAGLGDADPAAASGGSLVESEVLADVRASISYLLSRPFFGSDNARLASLGFGPGGHATYLAACTLGLRAAVCFWPTGLATGSLGTDEPTLAKTPALKGRVVCFFAGRDASITPDDRERIRNALAAQGPGHAVVVYDEVERGFFNDRRSTFDAEAASDAWLRLKGFLADELGP